MTLSCKTIWSYERFCSLSIFTFLFFHLQIYRTRWASTPAPGGNWALHVYTSFCRSTPRFQPNLKRRTLMWSSTRTFQNWSGTQQGCGNVATRTVSTRSPRTKRWATADYWLLKFFDTGNDQELFQRNHYKDMIYRAFKLAPVCPLIER